MKHNDITELPSNERLDPDQFANIFNVYEEPKLGKSYVTYSINKTLNILDLNEDARNDAKNSYFEKYEVVNGDTWPLISYKVYNNINLWWLIANCNNIINPTIDPTPGTVIRILKEEYVSSILESIRTSE